MSPDKYGNATPAEVIESMRETAREEKKRQEREKRPSKIPPPTPKKPTVLPKPPKPLAGDEKFDPKQPD